MDIRYICKRGRVRCILEDDGYHTGQFYDIKEGDIVTQHSSCVFISDDGRKLNISRETLKRFFERYYTEEENKEWIALRNQAVVAFCSAYLNKGETGDVAVQNAIYVANHLIKKLKEGK